LQSREVHFQSLHQQLLSIYVRMRVNESESINKISTHTHKHTTQISSNIN
jgi:hypothetical protein